MPASPIRLAAGHKVPRRTSRGWVSTTAPAVDVDRLRPHCPSRAAWSAASIITNASAVSAKTSHETPPSSVTGTVNAASSGSPANGGRPRLPASASTLSAITAPTRIMMTEKTVTSAGTGVT
jgi:hypothetical protein